MGGVRLQNTDIRPWHQWYKGLEPIDFPEHSVYSLLQTSAERYPARPAIIYEKEVITYHELKSQVDCLAGNWRKMKVKQGDRIGLMLANHPAYIICYYAAQALGMIVVQINPMYTLREFLQISNDSKIDYLVFDDIAEKVVSEAKHIYTFKECMPISPQGVNSIPSLIKSGVPLESCAVVNPHDDVAVIQYTGGTTGKMKGAMLTHFNLLSNVVQSFHMYGGSMIPGKETVLAATPLYHVYAMTSAMNLGIYMGATILLFRKFDLPVILDSIQLYRPTFFPGVPKMYAAFSMFPGIETYDLSCLKICSSGSAPLPLEIMKKFEALTNTRIGEGYGLSEASPSTHRNPPIGKRKVGSIGIPMPGTDCLIVDENHQPLGVQCVGELLISGPQIMKGYWNNQDETDLALRNGWLYTGDLALMDQEGFFYIVGRKKEMIIISGFNIYPQEIESVLYEHPDIQEAAVVGIPSLEAGEAAKAFIVPNENVEIDLDEIKGYCYSKLTPYKVPKEFEIRSELPRNTVGKLLKRLLVIQEMEKEK
ncbi:long-chain fatty acid--CoA ligase [Peribacillus psychrosaccharolyticus]|uniref:Long-chain fatty acid--CoA ligase n=1 Tax=Peribacillus psychrosaccharolyticus TaxID=1407 RepID=A0A974S109_PERPY|nr:long-chain fatty acid--CoA ligase [Peribacillus psychrosaccharolyticus]